jgi:hypothetical protein
MMNFVKCGRTKLVGRGSRLTEVCFRTSRPFGPAGSIGSMNLPGRWVSRSVPRLGKLIGLTNLAVGTSRQLCEYQSAILEPRPTKFAKYYVCS